MKRRRILFVGEAVTLAHVVRPLMLARALDPARYDVHVAWDARFDALVGDLPFTRWPLRSMPSDEFAANIASGRPVYDEQTLHAYVTEDRALLEDVQPDLVVGDMRLSLSVSARLAGIPYAAITNAHWSPCAELRFPAPFHPLTDIVGTAASAALTNLGRGIITRIHARPMNRVRAAHGLTPLPTDAFHHYSDADHVLYADIDGMVPLHGVPAHHHFLGPVTWSPVAERAFRWSELPDRPVVYVNLGSSGDRNLLPTLVNALAELPVTVVVATVGAQLAAHADNVYSAAYLSGKEACAHASLVVCNGGSGAVHQALLAGVPVLGITGNFDQQLNMQAPVRLGAAAELRGDRVSPARVRELAAAMLQDRALASAARALQAQLRAYDPAQRFSALVDSLLPGAATSSRRRPSSACCFAPRGT